MKLLFVITGLNMGGAEKLLITKCAYMLSKGYQVKVVTLLKGGDLIQDLIDLGVEVTGLDMTGVGSLLPALKKYKAILKAYKPDVVHAHMVHSNLFSRFATFMSGKDYVLINTVHDPNYRKNVTRNVIYRLTNGVADYVTTISEESCNNYIRYTGMRKDKIRYMDNSVNENVFRKDAAKAAAVRQALQLEDKFIWIAVGRLYEQKDYPNVIQAFRQLVQKHPEAHLLIVGKGPLDATLQQMINAEGLDKHITMMGPRHDIPDLLNAANAYVMSSAWEGQPIALLEAASSGLPIVATNVGGNNTVVEDGRNGMLVPARDSKSLYEAMDKIMSAPGNALLNMSAHSRGIVERKYSIGHMVDTLLNIYNTKGKRKAQAV